MNERMIELYTQAQKFAYKNISKEYWNTDNFHAIVSGKFAELIVKETMQVVANNLPQNTYLDIADTVIEHFGVEE